MSKLYSPKLTISTITKTLFILLFASNIFASHTLHRTAITILKPTLSFTHAVKPPLVKVITPPLLMRDAKSPFKPSHKHKLTINNQLHPLSLQFNLATPRTPIYNKIPLTTSVDMSREQETVDALYNQDQDQSIYADNSSPSELEHLIGNFNKPSNLVTAIKARNTETALALLQHCTKVDEQDHNGYTALMHAIDANMPEVVAALLNKNATIEQKDYNYCTCLMHAMALKSTAILELLLQHSHRDTAFARTHDIADLIVATNNGRNDMIDMLLRYKFNIDAQAKTNIVPIHYYSNTDINKQIQGNTVLMFCIMQHNVAMVEYLLSRGANINLKNAAGKNALKLAKDMQNEAIKESEQAKLGSDAELIKENAAILLKTEKIITLVMDAPNKLCNNASQISFASDQ